MKCANCEADALYVYDAPGTDETPYCDKHLPSFLRAWQKAGVLTTTEQHAAKAAEVAKLLAPKKTKKVEEPVVEVAVEA